MTDDSMAPAPDALMGQGEPPCEGFLAPASVPGRFQTGA